MILLGRKIALRIDPKRVLILALLLATIITPVLMGCGTKAPPRPPAEKITK